MTDTDDFTEAARVEAIRAWVKESDRMDSIGTLGAHMAEWARTHLAAEVRKAKAEAWDEGYMEATNGDDDPLANPYRYEKGDGDERR